MSIDCWFWQSRQVIFVKQKFNLQHARHLLRSFTLRMIGKRRTDIPFAECFIDWTYEISVTLQISSEAAFFIGKSIS